jgi:hypothetical protein
MLLQTIRFVGSPFKIAPGWEQDAGVAFLLVFLFVSVAVLFAFYIYLALALSAIAKRTNTEPAWIAWVPVANLYLCTKIGGTPWWSVLLFIFLGWVPGVPAVIAVWWWWKIAEARHKEGWWGLLMVVPIVNLVVVGLLAWGE